MFDKYRMTMQHNRMAKITKNEIVPKTNKIVFKTYYKSMSKELRAGKWRWSFIAENDEVNIYLDASRNEKGDFIGYVVQVKFCLEKETMEVGCFQKAWRAKREALAYVAHRRHLNKIRA